MGLLNEQYNSLRFLENATNTAWIKWKKFERIVRRTRDRRIKLKVTCGSLKIGFLYRGTIYGNVDCWECDSQGGIAYYYHV